MRRKPELDSRFLAAGALALAVGGLVLGVTAPPDATDVLVTSEPVAAGVRLGDVGLEARPVVDPTGLVLAASASDLADRVLLVDLGAGSPILHGALADPDAESVDVVGIRLDSAAAVHGALEAGDAVDIYVAGEEGVDLLASGVPVVTVLHEQGALGHGDIGVLLGIEDASLAPPIVAAAFEDSIHLVRRGS